MKVKKVEEWLIGEEIEWTTSAHHLQFSLENFS